MRRLFNNTNLLIVAIAVVGALAGFLAGGWLQPHAPQSAMSPSASVRVGDPRPDLELPDLHGRTQSLSRWDGNLVLLNFWASWCGPCRDEMPLLDATQKRFAPDGLQVVGVAVDDEPAVRGFLAARPVGYPILIDASSAASDASQTFGNDRAVLPYSVLIGPDRRILAQRFGSFTEQSLDAWLAPHLSH